MYQEMSKKESTMREQMELLQNFSKRGELHCNCSKVADYIKSLEVEITPPAYGEPCFVKSGIWETVSCARPVSWLAEDVQGGLRVTLKILSSSTFLKINVSFFLSFYSIFFSCRGFP